MDARSLFYNSLLEHRCAVEHCVRRFFTANTGVLYSGLLEVSIKIIPFKQM
jgi:hypothetical protein